MANRTLAACAARRPIRELRRARGSIRRRSFDALYLVYARRGANNDHVFRHREPLFIAKVDTGKLAVKKNAEQILISETGARYGNLGVCDVSDRETRVIETEWIQRRPDGPVIPEDIKRGAAARFYAARINWEKPDRVWDKH